ncbi:MOSC domain-containing protein [Kibdelosporangium persicum]|uniref:MOSC domain-containing protein YiiM n=1 Tax=Kibdelosporangium persicum TaxID=2698649 RepID=A0ABX2F2E6_9PSEU|nr:MOSC domain-containing protein [Kibdelosporangium persicum]NRN65165.1 MOSC domain-containing protein YiiM [Kibdelosporangium persicum]
MGAVLSVNVGDLRPMLAATGHSGIDKRPVTGPVAVSAPEAGASGLAGDKISDGTVHGGPDRAVYAYAREDLDDWQKDLGTTLPSGGFGENLTTIGVDVNGAEIGERWRVGHEVVLEVSAPRTPCRTFAAWLERGDWIRTFIDRGVPGAYLRVIRPGAIRAGDAVEVLTRPGHGVTVDLVFQAITRRPDLLTRLTGAEALAEDILAKVLRRTRVR